MKVMAETQLGSRTVAGTEWPLMLQVYRLGSRYIVARICNQVAEHAKSHTHLWKALLDYEERKLGITQRSADA